MRSYTSNYNFLRIGDDDIENFNMFHRDSTEDIVSRPVIVHDVKLFKIIETKILSVSNNRQGIKIKLIIMTFQLYD